MTEADMKLCTDWYDFCSDNGISIVSVGIAQEMIESAHGKSDLYLNNNNVYGIKYTINADYKVTYSTKEYINGQYITIDADFAGYNSLENCYKDYCRIVSPSLYKTIEEYLEALKRIGYATSPSYIQLIKDVIRDFELERFDNPQDDYDLNNFENACLDLSKAQNTYNMALDTMAYKVIDGAYGNGDDRRQALGMYYNVIQDRVDEILGGEKA